MSQDKQKSIAAMRTFARDLSRERGEEISDTDKKDTVAEHVPKKHHHNDDHRAAAPAPVAPPKKSDDASIPAFHELNKKTPAAAAVPTPILGAVTSKKPVGISPERAVSGGTIITDNKIAKKSFFVALSESTTAWIKNLQKQFKRKKKPTYSVTSTERRKGVVQKATSKSGAIFSADKQELREIIKKRQRDAEQKQEDDTHEDAIEWTPFTEPGFLLLDGAHEEIIASGSPAPKKPVVTVTPKQTAAKIDFVPPPPTVAPVTSTPPVPAPVIAPTEPDVSANPPLQPIYTEPVETVVTTAPARQPIRASKELEPESTTPWWSLAHLYNLSTNEMTVLAVAALIVLTVGGYVGITIATPDTSLTPDSPVPVLSLTSTPLIAITATSSKNIFAEIAATQTSTVPAELYFAEQTGERSGIVVLQTLINDRGDIFIQTADVVRIITAADGSRVLIVRVTDTINARGGLLDWEPTLYRDIAPILSGRDTMSAPIPFTDSVISGVDVRTLSTDTQSLLVYGFVDDRTVIIAPSSIAFSSAMSILTN